MNYSDYVKAVKAGSELPQPEQTEYRIVLETLTFDDNVALVTGRLYRGDEQIAMATHSSCQYRLEQEHVKAVQVQVAMELGRGV